MTKNIDILPIIMYNNSSTIVWMVHLSGQLLLAKYIQQIENFLEEDK